MALTSRSLCRKFARGSDCRTPPNGNLFYAHGCKDCGKFEEPLKTDPFP